MNLNNMYNWKFFNEAIRIENKYSDLIHMKTLTFNIVKLI